MDDVTRRDAVVAAAGVAGVLAVTGQASAQAKPADGAKDAKEAGAAAGQEGSEFILKLSGIKLPPEVERRVAAELQSTLLREIARVDLKTGVDLRAGLAIRIPNRDWFGIWIERARGVGEIPRLKATQQPG